jgi:tetratricopeptide (TPR) repeat protein
MQNNENDNIGEKINEFIKTHRKAILITVGILLFLFIGFIAFLSLSDALNKKANAAIDELYGRYDELSLNNDEDFYAEDLENLLADLKTFAEKNKGFAGSKAWSMVGQIYSGRKDWSLAQDAWLSAAKIGNNTYLAPIALFNAAAASEEQGNLEQAIDLLKQCVAHKFEFPAAPRAQFSIGRLYETIGDSTAAVEAYRDVLIKWPEMPVWQNLARSRLAFLEVK